MRFKWRCRYYHLSFFMFHVRCGTHEPMGALNPATPMVGSASFTDAARAPLEVMLFNPAVISLGVIEVTMETVYDTI